MQDAVKAPAEKKPRLDHGLVNAEGRYEPIPYKPLSVEDGGLEPPPLAGPSVDEHAQQQQQQQHRQHTQHGAAHPHKKQKATRTSKANANAKKLMDFLGKIKPDQEASTTSANSALDAFSVDPPSIQRSSEMQAALKKR